jgi:hypothetical protein
MLNLFIHTIDDAHCILIECFFVFLCNRSGGTPDKYTGILQSFRTIVKVNYHASLILCVAIGSVTC